MKTLIHTSLFLFVTVAGTSNAFAQGTLTRSNQQAQAGVQHMPFGGVWTGNGGITQSTFGTDFVGIEDRSHSWAGFSGRGYAYHGATFIQPNTGIGGPFSGAVLDACTSAEIFDDNPGVHEAERAWGFARGAIEFTLDEPMDWTWIGGWQGNTFNTGSYHEVSAVHSLVDMNGGTQHVFESRVSFNGIGDWFENFSRGGTLQPGQYRLTWSHESIVTGGNTQYGYFPTSTGGAPLVSCINSTFRLVPVPASGSASVLMACGLLAARRGRRSRI